VRLTLVSCRPGLCDRPHRRLSRGGPRRIDLIGLKLFREFLQGHRRSLPAKRDSIFHLGSDPLAFGSAVLRDEFGVSGESSQS